MNEIWNPNELYHHGIKGQKWGVRRFENYDGTLTQAGKDRYGYKNTEQRSSSNKNSIKDFYHKHKKAINTTAAIAATALLAYGAYKVANIDGGLVDVGRNIISDINTDELVGTVKELGNKAGKVLSETGVKAGKAVGEAGVRAGKAVGKSIAKGTDAAISAAMATAGSIAILKIAEKYAPDDSDSELTKNIKKIAVESATAGINAATNANASTNKNNNNSNKGGSVGKEVTEAIGAPSNKGIDKSSARYQALFKDSNGNQRDADTRAIIKSMASAGYDIEQIEKYLELKHSYMLGGLYHSDIWNPDVLCHSDTVFGAGNQNGKSELYHHGIKGQKWGVRRFQNKDGTLTSAGKDRYSESTYGSHNSADGSHETNKIKDFYHKHKKAINTTAAIAGAALLAYGAYKVASLDRQTLNRGQEFFQNLESKEVSEAWEKYDKANKEHRRLADLYKTSNTEFEKGTGYEPFDITEDPMYQAFPNLFKTGRSQARVEQKYEDYAIKSWDKQAKLAIKDEYSKSMADLALRDQAMKSRSNVRKMGRASIELENALKKELKRRGK